MSKSNNLMIRVLLIILFVIVLCVPNKVYAEDDEIIEETVFDESETNVPEIKFPFEPNTFDSKSLISLGDSNNPTIVINKDTKINYIKHYLGEPKVETDSAFGGKAYTFYTDNNYSNYLYVETDSSGVIKSYGSVGSNFRTNGKYNYNDDYNYNSTGGSLMNGFWGEYNGKVTSCICYVKTNGIFKNETNNFNSYLEANNYKYVSDLNKHIYPMFNAVAKLVGRTSNIVYTYNTEKMLEINDQLIQNGSSLRTILSKYYTANVINDEYFSIGNGTYSATSYYLINPLLFANMAEYSSNYVKSSFTTAIFSYVVSTNKVEAIYVNNDIFDTIYKIVDIPLSEKEQMLYNNARAEYLKATDVLYNIKSGENSKIYTQNPQWNNASSLVAGKTTQSFRDAMLSYVNSIRIGAGYSVVKGDNDAFDIAQHHTTLEAHVGKMFHMVSQPAGVSTEFYRRATGYGTIWPSTCEASGSYALSGSVAMRYIKVLIDDRNNASSDAFQLGHRSTVLNPRTTTVGIGFSRNNSSSYLSYRNAVTSEDYTDYDYTGAWPSPNGITFIENITGNLSLGSYDLDKEFIWSIQFLSDKYTVTDDITTTVKCLNTGETFEYSEAGSGTTKYVDGMTIWSGDYLYENDRDREHYFSSVSNKIYWLDSRLKVVDGYQYIVTIHGLTNAKTGNKEEYSYTVRFMNAERENMDKELNSVSITADSNMSYNSKDKVYEILPGTEYKLSAVLSNEVDDRKLTWSSSSNNIKITQNGYIKADKNKDEIVYITVSSDKYGVSDNIKVVVKTSEVVYTTLSNKVVDKIIDTNNNSSMYVMQMLAGNTVSNSVTKSNFPVLNSGYSVSVYGVNNELKSNTNVIGTRNVIVIKDSSGVEKIRYTVAIPGDANGDGFAKIIDSFQMIKEVIQNKTMDDIDYIVMDYDKNGRISMLDAFQYFKAAMN